MVFSIEINGRKTSAKSGETILTVLNRNGVKVPTLCYLAGFSPTGACRMCVVEVEGMPELVTSCSHPVEEWMKIHTHSPRVLKARKTLVELLLASHPDDCLYCDRSGLCELQTMAEDLQIRDRKFRGRKPSVTVDRNCASVERDPSKCILCGRCIRVCDEVIGVSAIEIIGRGTRNTIGTTQNKGLNIKACVKCGQCILVCPTGALRERSSTQALYDALQKPGLYPVAQLTPAVTVSIAESLGLRTARDPFPYLKAALLRIGFREVHETSVASDLQAMEIASILVARIKTKEKMPLFTSCCPAWVSAIRTFRPSFIPYLSALRSPMLTLGRLVKDHRAPGTGIDPANVFSVAVTTCTAAKTEAFHENGSGKPVDLVITSRELIRLFRLFGIDFSSLEPDSTEAPESLRGTAGQLSGTAGGTMEGLLRTFYFQMTGQELPGTRVMEMRGQKNRKEIRLKIGKQTYGFMAVNGLHQAKLLVDEIENGRSDLLMVEVMACPSGCINGGGQPYGSDEKSLKNRAKNLYDSDEAEMIRQSHKNPMVTSLFRDISDGSEPDRLHTLLYSTPKTESAS